MRLGIIGGNPDWVDIGSEATFGVGQRPNSAKPISVADHTSKLALCSVLHNLCSRHCVLPLGMIKLDREESEGQNELCYMQSGKS